MPAWLSKIQEKIDNPHLKEVLLGSGIALTIKMLAAGSAFVMSVVVARELGAEEAGLFFLALTIVSIAAAAGRMGLDNSIVRFIAGAHAEGNSQEVCAVSRKAICWAFSLCCVIFVLIYLLSSVFATVIFDKPELSPVLVLMAFAIPFVGMYTLYSSALKGLRRVAKSVVVLNVAMPVAMLAGTLILSPSTALGAAKLYVCACLLAMVAGFIWWRSACPEHIETSSFNTKKLWSSCAPLWAVVVLQQLVMWSSQLLLGVYDTSENVAMFAAAQRTATLISFVLVAINTIAAPKFAAMHRQGDNEGLRYIAKWSVRLMLLAATPCLVFMWVFPEWILGFFGTEFKHAASTLMILALAQFINVSTGSVGFLLSMTGNEKQLRQNTLIGATLGVVLGMLLIPPFGLIGAAFSSGAAVATQNLLGVYEVRKKLGFNTLAIWRL